MYTGRGGGAGMRPTAADARFGLPFGYLTPTSGQVVYPGMYPRMAFDTTPPLDASALPVRRRPSMMHDFLASSSNQHDLPPQSSSDASRSIAGSLRAAEMEARRVAPSYTPQVENISPTPDDDAGPSRSEIGEKLEKVELEIRTVELQIKTCERRMQDLEAAGRRDDDDDDGQDEAADVGGGGDDERSLFERIYADNRRKAAAAAARFSTVGTPDKYVVPLYREPSDSPEVRKVQEDYKTFRPILIQHLRRINAAKQLRERYLTEQYNSLHEAWKKRVDRWEKNPRKIARDEKNREIFERTFAELKKQREERERLGRVETRTTSGGLLGDGGGGRVEVDVEDEERKVRQQAVVPPLVLDRWSRVAYINNNGLVRDAMAEHKLRLDLFHMIWTDEEKRVFREKLVAFGKNFAAIAVFLERKSTQDVVQYYYLTKKKENYKQVFRRHNRKRGKVYKPPRMPRLNDDGVGEAAEAAPPKPECEHACILCKVTIEPSMNPGRVLTRSNYEMYGLNAQLNNGQDVRICQKCRLGFLKKRYSHCPLGTCKTHKRKVKPTRPLPPKWKQLTFEQKQLLRAHMQMPDNTNKCCSGCHKRLGRKVDLVLGGHSLDEKPLASAEVAWTEEESERLRRLVDVVGSGDWQAVAQRFGEATAEQCQQHFERLEGGVDRQSARAAALRVRATCGAGVQVRVTQVAGIESEEEDNSEVEDASAATSAKAPRVSPSVSDDGTVCSTVSVSAVAALQTSVVDSVIANSSQPQESFCRSRSDSNATLSADEVQSEGECVAARSSDNSATLAESVSPKSACGAGTMSLLEVFSRRTQPLYKPKFRLLRTSNAEVPPTGMESDTDATPKQRAPSPVVVKAESPDVQFVGQRCATASAVRQRAAAAPLSPALTRSPLVNATNVRGSLTAGWRADDECPKSMRGTAGTPVVRPQQPMPPSGHLQLPFATASSNALLIHAPPHAGLLRPASAYGGQQDLLLSASNRVSPLVFSQMSTPEQAYNQAVAQQQYLHARQVQYDQHMQSAFQQQLLQPIGAGGQRPGQDARMHAAHLQQQQESEFLRRQIEMQHQQQFNEQQRRMAIERQQQHQRLLEEQQRAMLAAAAAEHTQRAALLGQRLSLAAEASRQHEDNLIAAMVAEHQARAFAEAHQRLLPTVNAYAGRTRGEGDSRVKAEPRSPASRPVVEVAAVRSRPSTAETPGGSQSVIRCTSRGADGPLMTKGAKKEFPPSLNLSESASEVSRAISPLVVGRTRAKVDAASGWNDWLDTEIKRLIPATTERGETPAVEQPAAAVASDAQKADGETGASQAALDKTFEYDIEPISPPEAPSAKCVSGAAAAGTGAEARAQPVVYTVFDVSPETLDSLSQRSTPHELPPTRPAADAWPSSSAALPTYEPLSDDDA